MKKYMYIVNGKLFPQSKKAVNEAILKMEEEPEVLKFEYWSNGRTSSRKIKVKKGQNGFTIS